MKLASIRLVTADVDRLIAFYEMLTGVSAERPSPAFGQLRFSGVVLAISSESMIRQFNAGAAVAGANRSALIEFQVDDVEAESVRLAGKAEVVMPPATMPWGNRSMILRDPDGNTVNIFAPPAGRS